MATICARLTLKQKFNYRFNKKSYNVFKIQRLLNATLYILPLIPLNNQASASYDLSHKLQAAVPDSHPLLVRATLMHLTSFTL